MSEYIDYNAKGQLSNFKKQFVQAYITLLQSIASYKAEDLEDICEANLFNSFSFNLSQLRDLTKEAQILNFDGVIDDNILENRMKLQVVDYAQYFGANIDRKTNADQKLYMRNTNRGDYQSYFPENIRWGDSLKLNWYLLVRLETDIKLNLINNDGQSMIDVADEERMKEKEVHFI